MITLVMFSFSLWLTHGHAETAPTPAQIGQTLWLAREASILADSTPATAVARLPQMLKQDFGVNVSCGKGQLLSPSAPRCLIGLRKVARSFYRGLLGAMEPALAEVLLINVTDEDYPHLSTTDTTVRINMPYTMNQDAIVAYVARAAGTPALARKLTDVARYKKTVAEWESLGLMELDFDPNLPLAQKEKALRTLIELGNDDPALFERPSEVLYVSNYFKPIFERRLRLEEAVKAEASVEDVRRFLNEAKVETPSRLAIQARVDALRERIRIAGEQLERTLKVKYDCSDESWLSLQGCARTLEHLARFIARRPGFEVDVKMILVVASTDLAEDFDIFQSVADKKPYAIMAVRQGFNARNLQILAEDRGWTR